jgi:uncharacterized protein with PIN domain
MVIDASAVLAVLLGEEDAAIYANAIEDAADPKMSAVSGLEVTLVIGARKREPGLAALDRLCRHLEIRKDLGLEHRRHFRGNCGIAVSPSEIGKPE